MLEEDLRSKIVESKKRKMEEESDELRKATEALQRVEQEMEKMKAEMELMKGTKPTGESYALGFIPTTFLAMNYTKALSWVAEFLALELKKEMKRFPKHFSMSSELGDAKNIGFKTCARYNRGEECPNMWQFTVNRRGNRLDTQKSSDYIAAHSARRPWELWLVITSCRARG